MHKAKMLGLLALGATTAALAHFPTKEPNLHATKAMLDYLVSFKDVNTKKDTTSTTYTARQSGPKEENTYTEDTTHVGHVSVSLPYSIHHFGSDDFTQCSREEEEYRRNRYPCTIQDIPTELYTKLKQEADGKRLKGLVEKLSPQSLTVLKHAFATKDYLFIFGGHEHNKDLWLHFDKASLHPEVAAVMQKVKSDAKKLWFRQPSTTYERLRYLLTGHEAYFLKYDEHSAFHSESLFMHPDSSFTCVIQNLNVHAGNIELLKKAVEQKVGKAVYPEKSTDKDNGKK